MISLKEPISNNTKCRARMIVQKNTGESSWHKYELITHDVFYDDIMSDYKERCIPIQDWIYECVQEGSLDDSINEILEQYQVNDYVEILGTVHSLDTSCWTDCGWEYDSIEWLEDVKHAKVGAQKQLDWDAKEAEKELNEEEK